MSTRTDLRAKVIGFSIALLALAVPLVVSQACNSDSGSGGRCQGDNECNTNASIYCSAVSGQCETCIDPTGVPTENIPCARAGCTAGDQICIAGSCASTKCGFCADDAPCTEAGKSCFPFDTNAALGRWGQCSTCAAFAANPVLCGAGGVCFHGQTCINHACIPDTCATATDAGTDAAISDGSTNDSSTSTDANDGSMTATDSGDAGACTTLALTSMQTVLAVGGNPQPGGGGTLVDGTYLPSGNVIMYGTFVNVANVTIGVRISGNGTRFERIEMDSDGYTDMRNQDMTAANAQLALGAGCTGNPTQLISYDTSPAGQSQTLVLQWKRPGATATTFVETYLLH